MPLTSKEITQSVATRVDIFVRNHFHLDTAIRLHRSALGWDLLRAPVNVVLAPVFLLVAMFGAAARLARFHRLHTWLSARRILLKTSVARDLEASINAVLLKDIDLSARSRKLISDYTSIRSATAEITTSLFVLLCGWIFFGATTPGIISLAPAVSNYVGHATAVTDFPLGAGLGQLWYGVFPVTLPVWFVVLMGIGLAIAASIVTTFAGVVADPIQSHLGIHKRRLIKLLGAIAAVEGKASSIAPEHLLARLADITDAGISLVRLIRS